MPPRDEQDYEDRRQQIIDGALEVFAERGFEKATNKDIAEAAGINSPGLIYHYFKDKADLLEKVFEHHAGPIMALLVYPEALNDLPPREALTRFTTAFLSIISNRTAVATLKLIFGESVRRPTIAAIYNRLGPARGLTALSSYLATQMDRGELRRMDTGAAARCFIGPLLAYLLTREVFPQPDSASLTPELMAETLVDIFLKGMEP